VEEKLKRNDSRTVEVQEAMGFLSPKITVKYHLNNESMDNKYSNLTNHMVKIGYTQKIETLNDNPARHSSCAIWTHCSSNDRIRINSENELIYSFNPNDPKENDVFNMLERFLSN